MSKRQIDACAARLNAKNATTFRALAGAADELFVRALALRRAAWALYRRETGLTVAGTKPGPERKRGGSK